MILLTTSALYGMQLDDAMRKHIVILQQSFPTLKPISRIDQAAGSTNGVIHAYYSPDSEKTHILTLRPHYFEQFFIDSNGKSASYQIIDLGKYLTKFDEWEILAQNGWLIKLRLDAQ